MNAGGWKATTVSQLPPTKKAPYRAAKCMLEERWRPLRLHHQISDLPPSR
jgi:hypothetical protein